MSMNLIAILVSLAMMLTGAGGAAQPGAAPAAETARTLTLSNVNVTWNGEALSLAPTAHVGVSTDGAKAVYDFGVDLDGKTLLPVQVSAGEAGLTALAGNGQAVTVTAKALEGLAEQLEAQMNASLAQSGDSNAQIMKFITEEYLPAYANMLKLAMDPQKRTEINATTQAIFDRTVDRGEGKPSTLEVDGQRYDVTAYSYSMDAMQIAALSDTMYTEVPELTDYYNALFKLYSMMPEESGLRDVTSLSALMEKFDIQIRMDIEEQRTGDGKVDLMDAELTIDMSSMEAAIRQQAVNAAPETLEPIEEAEGTAADTQVVEGDAAQSSQLQVDTAGKGAAPEAAEVAPETEDAAEAPALQPIVMNLHSLKLPDYSESTVDCVWDVDGSHSADISMAATENGGMQEMEMALFLLDNGVRTHGCKLSAFLAQDDTDTVSYSLSMRAIQQDVARVDAAVYGVKNPDHTSENSASVEVYTPALNAAVSFDLDVTDGPIEDRASAAKDALVIDDLSEAGIQSLAQDPAVLGALMQAAGAMTNDLATLQADPTVSGLMSLAQGKGLPINVDDLDDPGVDVDIDYGDAQADSDEAYQIVVDEDGNYQLVLADDVADGFDDAPVEGDMEFDFDDAPVEDDGVLAFREPKLNWLPEGWKVIGTETDTANDWVQMNIADNSGAECAYVIFFIDPEVSTANYIVQQDGKVLDGRMMNVTDFGEGGLSVTVSENGMYGNLMFTSEAIELDTIGKIVSGIEF